MVRAPVIPATQEAEAGELPEPRKRRLQGAKIAPSHSSLGDRARPCLEKKKKLRIWLVESDILIHKSVERLSISSYH